MRTAAPLLALIASLAAPTAHAHIALTSPAPRYADQKAGPCGRGSLDQRTTNVSVFRPGQTITVTWQETINHPGHYRIAFDPNGTRFTDPASFTDVAPRMHVLVDNIADKAGGAYSQQVTLPNVECTNCTLQLIQVMTDKPPYGDGNDIYYQCADIVLAAPQDAGVDLSRTPDLVALPDLVRAPDLWRAPDLGAIVDLAPVADLALPPPGDLAPVQPPSSSGGCAVAGPGVHDQSRGATTGLALLGATLVIAFARRRHRRR